MPPTYKVSLPILFEFVSHLGQFVLEALTHFPLNMSKEHRKIHSPPNVNILLIVMGVLKIMSLESADRQTNILTQGGLYTNTLSIQAPHCDPFVTL